jgi:hypothetical protein
MYFLKKISTRTISTFALVIGLIVIYLLPKNILFENNNTYCIHKILFNFECPGCGMTRAIYLTLHGLIKDGLYYNVAVLPFLIVVITYLLSVFSSKREIVLSYKYSLILFTTSIILQYIAKAIIHFTLN